MNSRVEGGLLSIFSLAIRNTHEKQEVNIIKGPAAIHCFYMGQPVIHVLANWIKPQSSLYYKSNDGYKGYWLLWLLKAGPMVATITGLLIISIGHIGGCSD